MKKKYINKSSIESGLQHWWHQKISAVLLLPITLWFIFNLPDFVIIDYKDKLIWINMPLNMFLLGIFFLLSAYHFKLGLTVVIEDYIHNERLKKILSITINVLVLLVVLLILIFGFYKILGI